MSVKRWVNTYICDLEFRPAAGIGRAAHHIEHSVIAVGAIYGNPKVCASSIEVDRQRLGRRTDFNRSIIQYIECTGHFVLQRLDGRTDCSIDRRNARVGSNRTRDGVIVDSHVDDGIGRI